MSKQIRTIHLTAAKIKKTKIEKKAAEKTKREEKRERKLTIAASVAVPSSE